MKFKAGIAARAMSAGALAVACAAGGPALASASTISPVPSSALTAPAASNASASSCLQGLSGPNDEVYSYQGITLRCGAGVTGITHIAQSHAIDEGGSDDVDIVECMARVISYGEETSAGSGNEALKWNYSGPGYAVIVWDKSSKNVVTLYDSGDNWARCGG